jgi:hypothetical protein
MKNRKIKKEVRKIIDFQQSQTGFKGNLILLYNNAIKTLNHLRTQKCYICGKSGQVVQLAWCSTCQKAICPECSVVVDLEKMTLSCIRCDREAYDKKHPGCHYNPISTQIVELYEPVRTRLINLGIKAETELSLSPAIFGK